MQNPAKCELLIRDALENERPGKNTKLKIEDIEVKVVDRLKYLGIYLSAVDRKETVRKGHPVRTPRSLRKQLYKAIVVPTVIHGLKAFAKKNSMSLRTMERKITRLLGIKADKQSINEILNGRAITKVVKSA